MYGMPYRKRTRIWNNIYGWVPRPLCKKDCESIENGKHKEVAQRGYSGKKETWVNQKTHKQTELYVIPKLLLLSIFFYICFGSSPQQSQAEVNLVPASV